MDLTFDHDEFLKKLYAESDIACVVLGAAVLDARLDNVFRRRLTNKFHDELLENSRPLGSFAARISLARALAWINDDMYSDLNTIRSIRNDFAHSYDHTLSFEDRSISDRCTNLKTAEAFINGFDDAATAPNLRITPITFESMQKEFKPPRQRYQLAIEFLSQYLDKIPEKNPSYFGPNFIQEVRSLSLTILLNIKVEMECS
ncbi:MAG: hypothetical protein D3922_06220 [Candidatus Electrothrix sp. AR1]|nr:hypothetical protein [Candidatus Electrothrix sp. AR1]